MAYSYTEKKRIRKLWKTSEVMSLPKLIETQLDSYSSLQEDIVPEKRENKGLEKF